MPTPKASSLPISAATAPAANVGFQKGDIILAVNNQKIGKTDDLERGRQA